MTRSHKSAGRAKPLAQAKPVVRRVQTPAAPTAPDKEQAARAQPLSRRRRSLTVRKNFVEARKGGARHREARRCHRAPRRRPSSRRPSLGLCLRYRGIVPPEPEETLLPVADDRGVLLGTALYSPSSQIALRLVSRDALDQARMAQADRRSSALGNRAPQTDARCRK